MKQDIGSIILTMHVKVAAPTLPPVPCNVAYLLNSAHSPLHTAMHKAMRQEVVALFLQQDWFVLHRPSSIPQVLMVLYTNRCSRSSS